MHVPELMFLLSTHLSGEQLVQYGILPASFVQGLRGFLLVLVRTAFRHDDYIRYGTNTIPIRYKCKYRSRLNVLVRVPLPVRVVRTIECLPTLECTRFQTNMIRKDLAYD
eukprot:scaffold119154_cov19-Prasinocladus_malaysianus.AAC.1